MEVSYAKFTFRFFPFQLFPVKFFFPVFEQLLPVLLEFFLPVLRELFPLLQRAFLSLLHQPFQPLGFLAQQFLGFFPQFRGEPLPQPDGLRLFFWIRLGAFRRRPECGEGALSSQPEQPQL